jgi:hypothetical protein
MRDRPARPTSAIAANMIQSVFVLVTATIFSFWVGMAGAFHWDAPPFHWKEALIAAGIFALPFSAVLASSILLWVRSRWGWYLALTTNTLGAVIWWTCLFRNNFLWEFSDANVSPVAKIFMATIFISIHAPMILLAVPASRNEYLSFHQTNLIVR